MFSYRSLKPYKYQIDQVYGRYISIKLKTPILTEFIELNTEGALIIKKYYSWDGPSGPTIDTKNFMEGSLVHDALYQLLRERHLDPPLRRDADQILRKICLEKGMSRFRAWLVYRAVRWAGGSAAKWKK